MPQSDTLVTPSRFLFALSEAMELATPSLARHQVRVAFIVWRMAQAAGLTLPEQESLFLTGLIHDLGALSPEEKLFVHESALSPGELARHCRLGAQLLADSPMLAPLAPAVADHHKPWQPGDEPLAPGALLHLGELFEHLLRPDAYILSQRRSVIERLRSAAPELTGRAALDLFLSVSESEAFWLDLASPQLPALLAETLPFARQPLTETEIWSLGETFRGVIDFRSHFTATHSAGVLAAASELARLAGFSENERRCMRLAGCLHDIGKMAVPNAILEKPGPLEPGEMDVMRQHTYHTARILRRAGISQRVTEWAAFHHERLDGRGYPFRVGSENIGLGARLMAIADIFTALAEDRPYRASLPREKVMGILEKMAAGGAVDPAGVERLSGHYDQVERAMRDEQEEARRRYQENFA